MTAVIGILNKTAVAIAADSAVTLGSNQKIVNTANKLFTLSKHHPVGIVVYNSSAFVSIPWEVLIKEYRRQQGIAPQKKLTGYVMKFVDYIKSSASLVSDANRKNSICKPASSLFESIAKEVRAKMNQDLNKLPVGEQTSEKATELSAKYIPEVITEKALKYGPQANKQLDNDELKQYQISDFLTYYDEPLNRTWNQFMSGFQTDQAVKYSAFAVLFDYFKSENFDLSTWSGIGILGYGDEELFPGCYMLHFAEIIGGYVRVKQKVDESYQVSDTNASAILPFAQRDVIEGFLHGIRPDLAQVYYQIFGNLLTGLNAQLLGYVGRLTASLPPSVQIPPMQLDVNYIVSKLQEDAEKVQQEKIINPVLYSVIGLSKDDLAEMAESLIHLTYLHRRINSAPESVGGPIDVAVISKGDGFIWIKRKFYFKPEINPGFVHNYFSPARN